MQEWKAINEFKRYIRLTNILQIAPEFQQHLRRVKIYSIWYKDKRRKTQEKPFNSRMSVFSAGQKKAIKATVKSPGTSASDPSSCSNCLAAKACDEQKLFH